MTRKVYRTAQGKLVDLGRLQLQNENTRAVGNMGVNARGDRLDSLNKPVEKKTTQVQRQYNRQTSQTTPPPQPIQSRPKPAAKIVPPPTPEDFEDDFVNTETAPVTGLAAAIAKAREIKQEPLRSSTDTARHQEGVRKI